MMAEPEERSVRGWLRILLGEAVVGLAVFGGIGGGLWVWGLEPLARVLGPAVSPWLAPWLGAAGAAQVVVGVLALGLLLPLVWLHGAVLRRLGLGDGRQGREP